MTEITLPGIIDNNSLRDNASRLLHQKIKEWEVIGGGRNSKVYRAMAEDGFTYAIKFYFQDTRKRMEVEYLGLSFLWNQQVRNIPQPLKRNDDHHCAIYSFLLGEKVSSPSSADIREMLLFIEKLYSLSKKEEARRLPLASDACFSLSSTLAIIERRLQRLRSTGREGNDYAKLNYFLEKEFIPVYQHFCELLPGKGLTTEADIPITQRTLSPSDFGFHNALRTTEGKIFFLDFEYFGWDDPVKIISDVLLHPGMNLPLPIKTEFLAGVLAIFRDQPDLFIRLKQALPFYGLIWCLILLNEFISEDQQRRSFAAGKVIDTETLQRQLQKAESLLHKINKGEIFAPFGKDNNHW